MPRSQLAYQVADVSAAARSLHQQLRKLERLPSHLELLNMLARAAGYRNFQHFRGGAMPGELPASPPAAPTIDQARVDRVANHFDAAGRLLRWPARDAHARLCLWVLWSRIPAAATFSEREISELVEDWHTFGDHALLRRALVDYGLVSRTVDGRQYLRIEQPPPPELGALRTRIGLA
jgi:hypothetical protein